MQHGTHMSIIHAEHLNYVHSCEPAADKFLYAAEIQNKMKKAVW